MSGFSKEISAHFMPVHLVMQSLSGAMLHGIWCDIAAFISKTRFGGDFRTSLTRNPKE